MKCFYNLLLVVLTFSCVLILIGVAVYASDKGLDFSDESYSLLGYQSPEKIEYATTFYNVLYHKVFFFIEPTIVNLRLFRLVCTLLFSSFLGWSVLSWLVYFRKNDWDRLSKYGLILFSVLGGFLSYSWLPQTPSYNSFSLWMLQLLFGLLLIASTFKLKQFKYMLSILFIGFLAASLILIKFPNFIFFFPFVFLLISFRQYFEFGKIRLKYSARDVLLFVFGIALFGVFYYDSYEHFIEWWNNFLYKFNVQSKSGHSPSKILLTYYQDFIRVFKAGIVSNLWSILSVGILLVYVNKFKSKKAYTIFLSLLLCLLFVIPVWYKAYYQGGQTYTFDMLIYYLFLAGTILMIIITASVSIKSFLFKIDIKSTYLFTLLLAAPFVGTIGTNNGLSAQLMIYMSFFLIIIYLMLHKLKKTISPLATTFLLVVTAFVATSQTIDGLVFDPYRVDQPLTECQYSLAEITGYEIKVSHERGEVVKEVKHLLKSKTGFKKGDPILTFKREFGFIYLLEGHLPLYSWLNVNTPKKNCALIARFDSVVLSETIFIIRNSKGLNKTFIDCLADRDVVFGENYRLLGKVNYPFSGRNDTLKIWAPEHLIRTQ